MLKTHEQSAKDTAALIKADVGTEVVSVDFGSWDMHDNYGTLDWGRMQRDYTAEAEKWIAETGYFEVQACSGDAQVACRAHFVDKYRSLPTTVAFLAEARGYTLDEFVFHAFLTNLAAFGQSGAHRRFPRVLQLVGAVGCVVLAATLPWTSVLSGIVVLAVGIGLRLFRV